MCIEYVHGFGHTFTVCMWLKTVSSQQGCQQYHVPAVESKDNPMESHTEHPVFPQKGVDHRGMVANHVRINAGSSSELFVLLCLLRVGVQPPPVVFFFSFNSSKFCAVFMFLKICLEWKSKYFTMDHLQKITGWMHFQFCPQCSYIQLVVRVWKYSLQRLNLDCWARVESSLKSKL